MSCAGPNSRTKKNAACIHAALLTNSSDSFTISVTTNLQIFSKKINVVVQNNLFLYESIYAMAIDKFLYLFIFFREIIVRTMSIM